MKEFKGKISILMPAYNEEDLIVRNIEETKKLFHELECDYEIVFIDDGSSDRTYQLAYDAFKDDDNVIVKRNRKNYGKGRALKFGFKFTTGDVVAFLDADLDLHPKQLYTLFAAMRTENADAVVGSKWHPSSRLVLPKRRVFISKVYYLILWLLFGLPLRDTQTGIKLFKHEALEKVFPRVLCKRWAFDIEILANVHRLGYKIAEAPIELEFRREVRWGRMKFDDLWYTGMDTLAIFYRMYIMRYYDTILKKKAEAVEDDGE
ncbi:glycosyltransferase [Candidatus Auribacterota bacterium]